MSATRGIGAPSYVPMVRAVLLALVFALALPAGADAARRQVPHGWLGVVVDGPMTDPTSPPRPASGTGWPAAAPRPCAPPCTGTRSSPTGRPSSTSPRSDPLFLAAAQRGLGVLPVVQGTPDVGREEPRRPGLAAARQ